MSVWRFARDRIYLNAPQDNAIRLSTPTRRVVVDISPAEGTPNKYVYDVALSFLAEDEALAGQLADALRERMKVFVYSEHQKQLAGKDGLEEFALTFRSAARVVVVLHRAGYGATKWTRVEETAIKDRAFEVGWDFLVVISLKGDSPPAWLPRTKLWLGYERFGMAGAEAVVDARVHDQGGDTKAETARDRAARLARLDERKEQIVQFLQSDAGVRRAREEVEVLFRYCQGEATAIREANRRVDIVFHRQPHDLLAGVSTSRLSVTFGWFNQYSNTLRSASLYARELAGPWIPDGRELRAESEERYCFTQLLDGSFGWHTDATPEKVESSKQFAERMLTQLLDRYFANTDSRMW